MHADVLFDRRDWSAEMAQRWKVLAEELHRRLGPGSSLEPGTRGSFENELGCDLAGAVLHRGPLAGQLAWAFGAEALTSSGHVLGETARLDPATTAGAALLGHELTHVVRGTGALPMPAGGTRIQRSVVEHDGNPDEETVAQVVEASMRTTAPPIGASAGQQVDPEVLAERLYERVRDQLLVDRERAAWLG